jgi:thymidylate synthase (FAD)
MVAEFAGRGCYEAWARANAATRTNEAYLANIIALGHESVFGHAAISLRVQGVSRALTLELVRHRFLVFSQRSQRFVDESDCDFVCPPLLDDPEHADVREKLLREALLAQRAYVMIAETLIERGVPRKQAREAARAVLPECTETRLLVSGNVRAWRDFIKLRNADGADAEIRIFAQQVLEILRTQVAPNSVQDL